MPSRATPDGEPDDLIFGPSGSACAGITALSAITAARANLKARNLNLLEWTVFDAYVTTGHWRRFVPSSRAYSQVILARCGQLELYLLLSFPGRSGRSPRRGLSAPRRGLSAYVGDRHEPSDGDGGDGNSAVAKSRSNIPNIPNTVRAAALHKAARGFLAGDNWKNQRCRSETRSQHTSPRLHAEAPPVIRKTLQGRAHSLRMPMLSCAASCQGIHRYAPTR